MNLPANQIRALSCVFISLFISENIRLTWFSETEALFYIMYTIQLNPREIKRLHYLKISTPMCLPKKCIYICICHFILFLGYLYQIKSIRGLLR